MPYLLRRVDCSSSFVGVYDALGSLEHYHERGSVIISPPGQRHHSFRKIHLQAHAKAQANTHDNKKSTGVNTHDTQRRKRPSKTSLKGKNAKNVQHS